LYLRLYFTRANNEENFRGRRVREAERQELCDLCGVPGARYGGGHYADAPYDILACPACRLIWTNPLIYHEGGGAPSEEYWAEEVYLANAGPQKERFRGQLRAFLEATRPADLKALRVLEVGSGLGFFLDVCEEFGINAEGCDIEAPAVSYANRARARSRLGTLDGAYADASFDAVFAFNLIEHLPHPKAFFAQAHRVLKPGGALVLETPVRESLFHAVAHVGARATRGRLNFYGLHPGGHIYKFSRRTFTSLPRPIAFERVRQRNINSPFDEIWGKSAIATLEHRLLYRTALPALWALGRVSGRGNRIFIMLRKPAAAG
jgi:SAM-dependent methyltransferase